MLSWISYIHISSYRFVATLVLIWDCHKNVAMAPKNYVPTVEKQNEMCLQVK